MRSAENWWGSLRSTHPTLLPSRLRQQGLEACREVGRQLPHQLSTDEPHVDHIAEVYAVLVAVRLELH